MLMFSHDLELKGAQRIIYELAVGMRRTTNGLIVPKVISPVSGPFSELYNAANIDCVVYNQGVDNICSGWHTISDYRLVDRMVALAEEKEIPHQMEILPLGGTDQALLQRARAGARTVTLSVPTRYIHTATETIAKADLDATLQLLQVFCEEGPGE